MTTYPNPVSLRVRMVMTAIFVFIMLAMGSLMLASPDYPGAVATVVGVAMVSCAAWVTVVAVAQFVSEIREGEP